MATPLFAHLNSTELARAQSILLFADEQRLARKPRCSATKDHSVIRTASNALLFPYIQPNSPMAYSRIVLDLDWHNPKHRFHNLPLRYLSEARAWENDLGVPEPNWVALSRDKNSAHIAYELDTPVGRHEHARIKPQRYMAAVENALALAVGADEGFNGQLCKNPISSNWDLYKGPERGRDLHELADYVELTHKKIQAFNRTPRGEIGRNVFLFDEVRFWAYDNINEHRARDFESWEKAVVATAEHINAASYEHLPFLTGRGLLPIAECKAVGRSVARWVWANHGKKELTAAFSELQSWRGVRGAAAAAKVKRERREAQVIAAIGQLISQGQMPTMGKVAKLINCSTPTLSKHYKQLFHGTLH
ncbi:MAG: hypothetical protein RLZZ591_1107 [Pseudomonadota bacterium]